VTRIAYVINDQNHALLKRANMPSYFAHCDFRNESLARFRFEYP
jgi:hypothetical protein